MNFWLFQSVAERYDLREAGIVEEGKTDTWYATRYRGRMKVGDVVFFWLGGVGDERGIYAVGELLSEPYRKDEWESYGIDVKYRKKLNRPIKVGDIKKNKVLTEILILRAPQAANFSLTDEQGFELQKLIIKEEN